MIARTDDAARAELVMLAARIATTDGVGNPDRILDGVIDPSVVDEMARHRWFAVVLDALGEAKVARAAHNGGDYKAALNRLTLAISILLFGEPEGGCTGPDAETTVAAA